MSQSFFDAISFDYLLKSAPKEIRTPVLALRGPRPGPLDDGGRKPKHFIMGLFACQQM